jgi:hypothetical protein
MPNNLHHIAESSRCYRAPVCEQKRDSGQTVALLRKMGAATGNAIWGRDLRDPFAPRSSYSKETTTCSFLASLPLASGSCDRRTISSRSIPWSHSAAHGSLRDHILCEPHGSTWNRHRRHRFPSLCLTTRTFRLAMTMLLLQMSSCDWRTGPSGRLRWSHALANPCCGERLRGEAPVSSTSPSR